MSFFLKLFDLFSETAKKIAVYLPQSGSDVIDLFKKLLVLGDNLQIWIYNNIGIDLRIILTSLGRVAVFIFQFLLEFLKQIVDKIH